ncbi:MAG: STAS domain-containing protein [Phycisphaerales bacterium]
MSLIVSRLAGAASTILVVRVPPQLVDDTASLLRAEVASRLPNADGAGVVLDFAQVELINSIGITCLLQIQDQCRRLNSAMYLAAVPEPIQTFLSQLKLLKRFPAFPSVEDALAAMDRE